MSQPKVIKEIITGIVSDLGTAQKSRRDEIEETLAKILDKKALRHLKVRQFQDQKLIINIDSSAWLYRLKLEEKTILNKLNTFLPGLGVNALILRLGKT